MARPPTLTRTGFPYAIDDRTQLGQTRQIRLHRVEGIPAIESDEDFRMPRRHGLYGASRVDVSFGQAQRGYQGVSRFLRQWRRELDRTLCHRDTTTRHERDLAKAIARTQRERGRRGLGLVPVIAGPQRARRRLRAAASVKACGRDAADGL